jgi:hypothetical protein
MVMTPDEPQEEVIVTDITPPEPVESEAPPEPVVEEAEETPSPEAEAAPTEVEATQPPPPEASPQVSPEQQRAEIQRQMEMNELGQRRVQEQEQQRRQAMVQQAKQYEQNLLDEGLLPEQARKQTRQMVGYENRMQEQETKASRLLQFAEGRNIAALQLGMKHGLIPKQVVEDINVLLRSNSPDAMDFEAKRMAELRSTRAELSRLKQGQVQPQTFDNSQGSAEATTNESRLVDAYLAGDRSEAAVNAAKRLTFGS